MDKSRFLFRRMFSKSKSNDPVSIIPYRGYAGNDRLFLKGRVLEDGHIVSGKSDSQVRNFINSFRRFETDEIPEVPVRIRLGNETLECVTDYEGYFTVDSEINFEKDIIDNWLPYQVDLLNPAKTEDTLVKANGELMLLHKEAKFGMITDVDDTILHTHVTSLFRLKMLYATFFQNAHQRLPLEGMPELLRTLSQGSDNPVFYVSHSPWNIYDLINEFLDLQSFPKGPILLRDYGIKPAGDFKHHKIASISRILKTYPHLPFLLFGDSAEEDADFYLKIAADFPERIKAIFIRHTRNTKNARRIKRLIEHNSHVKAYMIHSTDEIYNHVESLDFLKNGL